MFEDRVDNLLDKANSKAKIKFKDASIHSHEAQMAVQNVLLAELIELLRERLPPNVPE